MAFSRSSVHTYIIILTLLCFTNRTDILHKWKTYCSTVVGRGTPTRLFRNGAESDWGNQLPTFDLSKEKVLRSAETKAKEYMRRYPGPTQTKILTYSNQIPGESNNIKHNTLNGALLSCHVLAFFGQVRHDLLVTPKLRYDVHSFQCTWQRLGETKILQPNLAKARVS